MCKDEYNKIQLKLKHKKRRIPYDQNPLCVKIEVCNNEFKSKLKRRYHKQLKV